MKLFSAVTLGSLLSVESFSPIQGHHRASATTTTTALNIALDREQAQQQVNGRSDPPSNETPKATKHWPRTLPNLETVSDDSLSLSLKKYERHDTMCVFCLCAKCDIGLCG